jgi:hypothetical protein
MHRPNAFSRATNLMVAMAALAAGAYAAMPGVKAASQEHAYSMLGGYRSRGKRKTKTHDNGGTRVAQRAAQKKRNQARHRRACRG